MLSVHLAAETQITMAKITVEEKSNEIIAVPELLELRC